MKRVAILVETALASGRAILGGISRYVHESDQWSVFHYTDSLDAIKPTNLDQWRGNDIIARLTDRDQLKRVKAKAVPVVDVLGNIAGLPYPLVKCDDRAIGRLVARHFLESGHQHFAFFGLSGQRWSLERQESFDATARTRAQSVSVFQSPAADRTSATWLRGFQRICDWLNALPKPVGLMVASDQFGPLAIEACQRLGLSVPEEVSVVGVDNDLPFCDLCQPRLSSVEPNHARVGYEAARLLDCLMSGEGPPPAPLEVPPLTLHRRPSSDAAAVSDASLVKALQHIRLRACDGTSVDDVARAAGLSRSVLQRRFRDQLGRTVGAALLAVKLGRARDMLAFTDLPLLDVAMRSGFNYQEYLNHVFKRQLGMTPAQYRAQNQQHRPTLN